MEILKAYRKKSFWIITVIMALLAAAGCAGLYSLGNFWVPLLQSPEGQASLVEKIPVGISFLALVLENFYVWVIPVLGGGFLVFGWGVWGVFNFSISSELNPIDKTSANTIETKPRKKDFLDQKIEQERRRRLYLHSLSVLQREGRLLDFFGEDLSLYEDDQIGAAVRSIQEDCKRAIKKYIDPKPVMDGEEGDSVTIEPGFDMDAITLVGNVSGEPPFQGILKHPGWKAGKKDVPKLSDIQNPDIMTPAEIEIP